jgi:pSer/pThr/pTyr-binding forkhead associated (FHA) protein
VTEKSYQLVVRKGPQPGRVFPLSLQSISLGRDPMSDITLSDPEVSRYHAQLLLTESGYQIQDMGSTNGTFIDGEHLGGQPILLSAGQTIQLGSSVVLVLESVTEDEELEATVADATSSPTEAEPEKREEPAVVRSEPEPAPPLPAFEPPPPVSPPSAPLVAPSDGSGRNGRRRTILIVLIVLLLCCCCAFLVSGYFYWGDPLLDLLQDLGLLNWLQDLGVSL